MPLRQDAAGIAIVAGLMCVGLMCAGTMCAVICTPALAALSPAASTPAAHANADASPGANAEAGADASADATADATAGAAAVAGNSTAPLAPIAASPDDPVLVIPVAGAIGPASADFIERGLARAAQRHAQLAVLQLDTPGGLDTSMRQIIQAILASPVPVATFIAPGGARAASAGTYITYSSHLAAMAPGTNLGAATPIQLGLGGAEPAQSPSAASHGRAVDAMDTASTETRKQVQDAAAYIRGLAQLRGRNADWAEHAVREAVSLPAAEALDQHVIDLIARDVPDLLHQADGRTLVTSSGAHRLATSHAPVVMERPDWRTRLLAVITDPSVALILMMIGVYGLFFEFANPGFVLPGVAGAISLLVGLFAMQMLPVNYVGLALVLLGLAFLIAEAFLPTFGTLGFGGIVAFAIGATLLIDTDLPGYGVPLPLIAAFAAVSALFVFGVSGIALRARRRPVVTGAEAIVGMPGVVLDAGLAPHGAHAEGWARVHGERWHVVCGETLASGTAVRVTARRGLTLEVARDAISGAKTETTASGVAAITGEAQRR